MSTQDRGQGGHLQRHIRAQPSPHRGHDELPVRGSYCSRRPEVKVKRSSADDAACSADLGLRSQGGRGGCSRIRVEKPPDRGLVQVDGGQAGQADVRRDLDQGISRELKGRISAGILLDIDAREASEEFLEASAVDRSRLEVRRGEFMKPRGGQDQFGHESSPACFGARTNKQGVRGRCPAT